MLWRPCDGQGVDLYRAQLGTHLIQYFGLAIWPSGSLGRRLSTVTGAVTAGILGPYSSEVTQDKNVYGYLSFDAT